MHLALAPDLLGYSAIRAARRRRIPLVASCHTRFDTYLKHYPYTTWAENILKAYLRFAYGAAREVYVPSQSMLEALVADGVKTVFRLWPRGVDTDLFHPEKRSPAFRAAYGIGENEFLIAFVSRLVREKNLETVIATVRLLASRGIAHRMIFVGDGPERALLEKELPNAVFTGFLTNEDLAAAYASSDVFLFPSETETFGSVTLEAMASGLPCVCANATGSRSLVLQDKTGNLVEPYDTETFADRIALLAQSPELRARFGAAARTRSLSFSWDESMALLLGHYRSLVAGAAA